MDSRNEGGHVSFWRRSPRMDGNVATRRPTIPKSIATDLPTNTASDLPVSEAAQDKAPPATIGAFVGNGSQIIGQARFENSIKIDGRLEGTISSHTRIWVGKTGTLISRDSIKAAEVIVEGSVTGDIVASERIRVSASGQVVGNLRAPTIAIDPGAAIDGHCSTMPCQLD
jgi:cytoskeletal protein CcmA (bactofilin family)